MQTDKAPVCFGCVHLDLAASDEKSVPVCKAYPNGIPDAIFLAENDHQKPFAGDNNIVYQELSDLVEIALREAQFGEIGKP